MTAINAEKKKHNVDIMKLVKSRNSSLAKGREHTTGRLAGVEEKQTNEIAAAKKLHESRINGAMKDVQERKAQKGKKLVSSG